MAYSIRLPDGTLVRNIPDELSPEEAKARIIKAYPQYAPESGDVFVPALKSGVSLAQEAGYALAGRTGLMDEAAAQKAIEEEQAYQRRVFKPTEEGFLEAPVTKTLELLGQSLPFMVLPVAAAGATLALPFTGAAATVAGLGAAGLASGAQFTGTNLLRQMEPTDEAPQGKSIGETDLGNAALAAVPQAALDVLSLRMMPFIRGVFGQVGKDLSEEAARRIASKNLKDVAADYALATGKTMTVEGLTEAAQQSLERLQAGLTMTDEAARDEYLESFIGGAVLGGVLAPPGRYLERRAAQKEVPPETKPEPTATQPTAPTPITDEDELTPEEEADLQARIAAAPPAAGLPLAPTPTPPISPAPAPATPEAVALPGTQQVTPQAAPELEVLTAQLARIQQARMDPTLSPDDPAFLEFDQQEAAIQARIQQLTAPPAAVTQPLAPPVAPVVEPEVIPEEALVEAPVVTPPQIQGPRFGLSSVLDSPAQPLAPEITPPADVESVVTPAVEEPVIEEPVARIKQDVQTELNRMRTSLKKAKTAVRKKLMPESEVTKLETRVAELEDELVEAKAGPRQIKYRSAKGNTWTGKGKSPPKWLRQKLAAGFELSDFEIRPELGNKSEVEVELEKPPGFGRPMPATRPPEEYERMAARLERAEVGGPNLFNELKGKLRDEDVIDIGRGKEFSFLRAGKGKGKFLVDLIDDGELNEFLPEAMQPESETYDASKSDEYLKKLLREDQSTDPEARITPEARDFLIPYLRFEISQLEAELEPEDVNQLIQEIVAEERAAIADIEASAIAEQERGPGVPGVTPDFALTGQTPEELAELQRKELSGEAEAERDRLEAEEAALAAAEAERKIADQKRETFQLAPPPSAPAVQAAGPVGDLFGTTGIREQPTRAPRKVAAEPSPIEKLAAEKAPTLEDETTERMRQLGVLDFDDASQKVQEAYGVSKPVADAYVRSVRKEAEEIAKSTFGMENEFQKAYDESTKLRNRMEGIRNRKKDKIIEKIQEAPQLQYAQDALAEYIARFRDKLPSTGQRSYDAQTNTITDVVNAKDDVTMPRADFDALVSIAKTLDSAAGKNYSIVVEDTPEKSSIFTFRPRSLKATDTQVNVFAQFEETNRYVEELTLDEQIKKSLKDFGLDDRAKASKKRQEEFGISKPVADALVRADIERMEMSARFEYGVAPEAEYKAASKKYYELLNKAEDISRKKKVEEKEDKPRATTAGMTITEIMAETERVKKQLAEMGMDPDVTYRPEDTSKEKREAKEAKRRIELTRLAGESSRIDKLTREPIIGNPGQRSAAERLARSVDGELLFLDGSRGLGIVFAKDREGNDAYLPIHAGKISRVDVRDFTGLKSTDQAYLKRVRSELVQDAGARQKRKDDEADMEFMLKGTEDEQKGIRAVAETVGGTPVYFDPDTNVGLVRGYGRLTGKPVYAMTMGDRYSTADVEESTVAVFAPYKAQLIEVKKRLEKEAEQKHKDDPFITFKNGVAMSEGIDASIGGIITEWKSMLGLENVNVYFSTIEDAKKNRDNFTGPHRAIGSGTLDAGEGGSMRRMQDGSYYVLFTKGTSKTAMLEILAHELGHVHEREAYQNAPQELKDKLKEAHAKWVAQRRGKTAREAVNMLRAKTTAQTTSIAPGKERAEDLRPYWSSFSEWYADQVSRWAVTDEKPVGVVEKFFARLGAALRRFYQTLKGQKYLPDETFVQYLKQVKPVIVEEIPGPIKDPVQIEMSFQMQKDLFGSTQEAKQIEQIMEVKGKKKLPPGRSPELTAAAQAVQAGTMTAEEFNKLVDIYKPIPLYEEPLKPATSEQVFDALDVKKREQINPEIPNGTKVGLRLDIPAFNRKGVFVVSIHQKRTASAPGKVIGYGSVAKAKNVTFGVGNQLKALEIAAGSAKDALQTMEGDYVNVTPEQALAEAQRAIKDPSYVQIGIDPTRHAYFYDRRTTLPVVSAEEVIQIGNMILAKKPVFGSKQDFLYNIEGGPVQSAAELDAKRDRENQEKLQDLKDLRPTKIALPEKVRSYASSEEGQRVIAALNMTGEELERTVQKQYEGYTADNFMRRARKGLDEGEISADVFAVVQSMYMADPKLLDGLRLDVKQKFTPEELAQRRAEGKPSPMGAFAPFERVVNLYTGTKGVTDPMTIRHELTHTLEQMMTPVQRKAVINAYIAALKKAAKKHKDAKSREFFDNVVKYLNEPSNDTRDAMNKSLPSLDFYQFTSPSEYWAVNAEKLMAQRLGVPWDRFKKAVRKMFEAMKKLFGFDNRFVVHDVFDKIMSGSKERMDTGMLANFVASSKQEYEMIEKTKEDAELVRRYNRTPTSQTDSAPLRRIMIGAAENSKDLFKSMVESPSEAINFMFNSVNRGVMFLRNKFIWFGSGINETDRIRYNGAVKTAEGLATASVALDNMIRGGNIATQVIMQGGVEFNKKTQMYGAAQKDKSMANVYRAEAKLKEKLGDQLGTDIEQGYLQAKRSRSIIDEVATREKAIPPLEAKEKETNAEIDRAASISKALDANPNTTAAQRQASDVALRKAFREHKKALRELQDAQEELKTIKRIREDKVTMSEQEIADFIQREEAHPELKEILDNFNAVNQNLLRFWRDVGLLSEPRYERLSSIKDYVPWYRVMDDDADIHDPVQATTRSATNIGKEKLFKAGKPSVVTDFTVEENQKVFKVQPGAVNAVKLNSVRLKPDQYEVTPNGEITLKVDAKPGQLLVVETQREIENMIDNMTRNVMRMTMNGLRKYAANRIVSEYATREAGKIKRFATADRNKGRFDYIENGRRTIVEIQDPLIAEAVLGMETVGMKMWEPLAAAANFTRRTITLSPVFQLKQVFKDAPTAALVTGVRNPAALMGGVMRDFIGAVRGDDPVAAILRSQGIGGFYSPARTPEADVKRQIGIINNNTYDYVMKALDHFGDSSDMAQRIAIYKRVMAETGDETLALYQAANVINFLRHGSGQVAQALVQTVPFLNAYAQSIDVLYDALRGGGLRGKDRAAALQQLAWTGGLLAGTTLIYAFLVGDDDDYMKMDDQSKIRSYMIPGTDVVLPMNTSAAFFFKAIPELLYNKVVNEGTENEVDAKRLRTAMKEAAVDLLLGPTPVPSAVKPVIEIGLDYNFFTSRPVTPRGMQSLDAYQQYDMRTSEAAKILSSLTGTDEKRVLNPMEADHLVRSIFGTAGAMVAWSSNLVGQASEFRPEMGLKEMPVTGAFLRPEVPRGREDLFYKLKDDTDRKYRTYMTLADRDNKAEAQAYINRHPNLIAYYEYTSEMDAQLKEINSAIRFIGETRDPSYTPELKRREIQEFLNLKQDILEGIEQFRKEAYAN
jgi:DNA-binding protein H-NS